MRFRPALSTDIPAVAALHADSWRRFYRGAYSDDYLDGDVLADRLAAWSARLATPDPRHVTIVADPTDAADPAGPDDRVGLALPAGPAGLAGFAGDAGLADRTEPGDWSGLARFAGVADQARLAGQPGDQAELLGWTGLVGQGGPGDQAGPLDRAGLVGQGGPGHQTGSAGGAGLAGRGGPGHQAGSAGGAGLAGQAGSVGRAGVAGQAGSGDRAGSAARPGVVSQAGSGDQAGLSERPGLAGPAGSPGHAGLAERAELAHRAGPVDPAAPADRAATAEPPAAPSHPDVASTGAPWTGAAEASGTRQLGAGSLAGFVHLVLDHDARWGSLVDNLHVAHTHQRGGLGSALIVRAARAAAERGATPALYLWVQEQNTAAQAFYTAHGGRVVERARCSDPGGVPGRLNGAPMKLRVAWPDARAVARPN